MTLPEFIRQNREELDACIGRAIGHVPRTASCDCHLSGTDHTHPTPRLSNRERALWVRNDESLYHWARGCGVRI